ncbi:uncharacterized protein EI97DRAFT_437330 [Westerdykella ornata]|uniref:Telomere length regulation protein conserved domain-containing protein n=1 Tax=Westerdykella ornata TaxID=318751 RepID=A0A6A6J9N4_WESOR|nr:uncharacterized protein EI97DRAFT_437330 [Westerdykella ornata]KAF2271949.1 hypothetical protein EI97DRAFT_437330 [Westerdykella ornata]
MDDLLISVSTTTVKRPTKSDSFSETTISPNAVQNAEKVDPGNPNEVLKALKSQPGFEILQKILQHLEKPSTGANAFNLITPTPVSAQIVDTLVNNTIPDYWRTLKETNRLVKELVKCLQNANGLGAILSRLRPLIVDCRQKKPVNNTRDPSSYIEDLIEILEKILAGDRISSQIWHDIRAHAQNPTQRTLMWKEYISQVASGRVLAAVAEAENAIKEHGSSPKASWLANGQEYSSWLGRNMAVFMKDAVAEEALISDVTSLCAKVLSLGYLEHVVTPIVRFVVREQTTTILEKFLPKMKAYEQRKYFDALISSTTKEFFGQTVESKDEAFLKSTPSISGAASLYHNIIKDNELLRDHLVTVLARSSIRVLDDSLTARRSVIAALAQDEEKLHTLLEHCLKTFGDSFYISHTPLLQQGALAQTLAITCGYVQRSQPMFLTLMAKSSYHVSGMSNRIAATSPKARFLGMAIGTAISRMVDKPDSQLKFDLEGSEADEALFYQRLTEVDDKIGSLADLKLKDRDVESLRDARRVKKPIKASKSAEEPTTTPAITEITGPRIVEVLSDSDEDSDLIPYAKPDSDPEDDTEDPTEINRNKPVAPVYIRDLIAGLRDQENYERHQLALQTAGPLIRRKANFGTEVVDHIEELASLLVGLQDNFELPDFAVHRQQALIAVLLAKPAPMAQWFARTFFSGDYSIVQRTAILTTLGLGARELAGMKDASTDDLIPPTSDFPSKNLPPHLHKLYSSSTSNPVAKLTSSMTQQLLSPLAASAADQLTGPNVVKIRTFSSRMQVEKRRTKPIPNALAQIVADNFFFPLTGRWWICVKASSSSSSGHLGIASGQDSVYTSPHLLPPFLQTLALLLHASGPNTLALPQMTREFWEVLLLVRGVAVGDKGVLSALLFAFLMLLEVNGERRDGLAREQGAELLETLSWVQGVFAGLPSGSEEDEKARGLCAAVVVRCQEVVEAERTRLMGRMMDF